MQVQIYIHLPDEWASRPTQALVLGNGKYKVLPTPNYNSEIETWEFLPGTIVECEEREQDGEHYLQAIRKVG